MENREFRAVKDYEIRQIQDTNTTEIDGYIAKFDSPTELFQGFYEKIDRGAFDNTLKDGHNIFLLYHHDWSKPLASTQTGTLTLSVDNVGLRFNATINDNLSYGKDAIELIKQGLISGCSFGFTCVRESNEYNANDDSIMRTLLEVELYEGSILCIPQYEDTTVFARAKEIDSKERAKLEQAKQNELDLELIKLELDLDN
ncbi:phage prohead protease HK97 family protein [Clostridium pasteurianum DSM 525 = ATCC 6013]|uniref:Phage prohead protease HK97 family protein n=1 Tax=Clostridium pasteurianum DSM 525 = ATCC 6013 TaxID=1262449 RepID=A0A0H3JBD4_CLOPA|nr:HK97 family phage prohead protease [Clostridium pasteurianum]AJA49535.1 phage prohead protease HK97 family protein [Clostridium pasteurianum DSM 525 = ATCC 6013]AJA53523.1 phage prohead protease HK97 family protein [Clostridium pasteurianum DSM 525 = ATCC 6013]AOZ76693.1 phage prohead protein [Clostridium pasteurianum DSM 525 = ATCC 6013]AOZ80490.1 phage prohead protein [Clostridium pasteurianum]ELP58947.1 phage prohead protease HK97 family protein [Clostridium pasteurianum DSM 525 = ATCC 6